MVSGHPSAEGPACDRESSPAKTDVLATVPHHQPRIDSRGCNGIGSYVKVRMDTAKFANTATSNHTITNRNSTHIQQTNFKRKQMTIVKHLQKPKLTGQGSLARTAYMKMYTKLYFKSAA